MIKEINYKENKGFRLLNINERLNKGEVISKAQLAQEYGVTEKTIQRDIDDLRAYMEEKYFNEIEVAIKYDKRKKGYYLVRFEREWLTNKEIMAIIKILLESRAFCKEEMDELLKKLCTQVTPNEQKKVRDIVQNEQFYYVPLKHNKRLLDVLWDLSEFIIKKEIIEINYKRVDGMIRTHLVKPVAIMFSEYYFYLISFMAEKNNEYPTVFRVDRLQDLKGAKEKFVIPYKEKFNDGEFRKRVQFMFCGELQRVIFEYSGQSIEAILDRIPTAQVLEEKDGVYKIKAESYGEGIKMWLRTQGDYVKIIEEI